MKHCAHCNSEFQPNYEAQIYCGLRCFHVARSANSRRPEKVLSRLLPLIEKSDGCWGFRGMKTYAGYGRLYCWGGMQMAHRVSYVLHKGEIPAGLWVLHKCDNPPCTNPEHLFLGTPADNNQDKISKGRGVYGSDHHSAKVDAAKVKKIRADSRPYSEISKQYGVSKSQVSCIKNFKTWAHVAND